MRGAGAGRGALFLCVAAAFALGGAAVAFGQQGSSVPSPPPIESSPLPPLGQPPGTAAPGASPASPAPPSGAPAPGAPAPTTPAPAAPAEAWLARPVAELQILNKIDTTRTHLSIAVGKTATFATLSIQVEACLVRPPNAAPDAAAYLEIADKHPAVAGFHGWLLAAEPGAATFEHPIYDVRLIGCSESRVAPAHH